MPRCIWTHETSDRTVPVTLDVPSSTGGGATQRTVDVLPEHEADLRAYNARATRYGRPFVLAMLAFSALLLGVAVGGAVLGLSETLVSRLVGLGVAAIGWLTIAFPFATPQTVGMLGVRRSIHLARGLGVLTVALGARIALGT